MISLEVSVTSKDVEGILVRLRKAIDRVAVLDEAGALLLNRIRTRFLSEAGPHGSWVPSKAGQKRRAAGGTGTLFDTGTLFHSIQLAGSGPDERSIQTDVPYADKHNSGLDGMPQRLFMDVNRDDLLLVERLIKLRADGVQP